VTRTGEHIPDPGDPMQFFAAQKKPQICRGLAFYANIAVMLILSDKDVYDKKQKKPRDQ
jgi:hypothetical protein